MNTKDYMTKAQIAKATFDHLKSGGLISQHGLNDKQVWRIGYIYAEVVRSYQGAIAWDAFKALQFECLAEALERFELDREAWLASRF
jgi:hypothetical protein